MCSDDLEVIEDSESALQDRSKGVHGFESKEYCNYGSLESFIWHRDPGFVRGRPDNVKRARELSEEMIWHFFHGCSDSIDMFRLCGF